MSSLQKLLFLRGYTIANSSHGLLDISSEFNPDFNILWSLGRFKKSNNRNKKFYSNRLNVLQCIIVNISEKLFKPM